MNLGGIDVFVHVVEAGNFSEAARRLGMPKSTVSLRVARLEKRLGVALLERTTRRVRPTEAGAAYFATATAVLSELRGVEEDLARRQREPRGVLRVSAPGTGGPLAEVFTSFLARYPEVCLDLHLSERRVDLRAENIDVAVRVGKLDDDEHLVAKKAGDSLRQLFASPGYLERRGVPRHPRELDGHELLRSLQHREIELVGEQGARVRVPLAGRFSANRAAALQHQAIAGLGIALLPVSLAEGDVRRGALAAVLPEWSTDPAPIYLVYRRQRFVPEKVRAFVEFALRALGAGAFGGHAAPAR